MDALGISSEVAHVAVASGGDPFGEASGVGARVGWPERYEVEAGLERQLAQQGATQDHADARSLKSPVAPADEKQGLSDADAEDAFR